MTDEFIPENWGTIGPVVQAALGRIEALEAKVGRRPSLITPDGEIVTYEEVEAFLAGYRRRDEDDRAHGPLEGKVPAGEVAVNPYDGRKQSPAEAHHQQYPTAPGWAHYNESVSALVKAAQDAYEALDHCEIDGPRAVPLVVQQTLARLGVAIKPFEATNG